jgi:hypothetical protein
MRIFLEFSQSEMALQKMNFRSDARKQNLASSDLAAIPAGIAAGFP